VASAVVISRLSGRRKKILMKTRQTSAIFSNAHFLPWIAQWPIRAYFNRTDEPVFLSLISDAVSI
jgi:hypothetical protein